MKSKLVPINCLFILFLISTIFFAAACTGGSPPATKCADITDISLCKADSTCRWDNTNNKCRAVLVLNYLELSFNGLVKDTNNQAVSAIGRNGDGSSLYFGNAVQNYIHIVNTQDHSMTSRKTMHPGATNTVKTGEMNFSRPNDKSIVDKIVAGPNDTALISLKGIFYLGKNDEGGLIEMKGTEVHAAWSVLNNHLAVGSPTNTQISNMQVMGNQWMVFVADKNATGGNSKFGAPLNAVTSGPKKAGKILDVKILASAVKDDDLFLAYEDPTHGAVVVPTHIRKDNSGSYLLNGDLNLDPANSLIKRNDTKIGAANNDTVSAMAFVGNFLLIGFKSPGDLLVYDTELETIFIRPTRDQWLIKDIAVSEDKNSAVISTSKGLLIFAYGKLMKLENGVKDDLEKLTEANVTENQPLVVTGLGEDLVLDKTNVGAVDIKKNFYIATSGAGIYMMKAENKSKNL